MPLQCCVTGSLTKVLSHESPTPWGYQCYPVFQNERFSLQIAYQADAEFIRSVESKVFFRAEGAFDITLRQVQLVPVRLPCNANHDEDYLTHQPAMLPDLLQPYDPVESVRLLPGQWRSMWVDVTAHEPGLHTLTLSCLNSKQEVLWQQDVSLQVSAQTLPTQTLVHTEWFHADCLADWYGCEVWSETHWHAIDRFMACAAEHGINMLLTPVVTPALDTQVGGERTTVQLLDISEQDGVYTFDFARLDRWIELCLKHGIRNIEICHLFTQWGARHAPKVMVRTSEGLVRRFGWETNAPDEAYTAFLHQLIPALKDCLRRHGVLETSWFHISDEPYDEFAEDYRAAQATVLPLLQDVRLIDALSSFDLYQTGIVKKPVVSTNHVNPFLKAEVPDLWVYHCCSQGKDVANRFMAMPSRRNRVLGAQWYLYNIEGFLHWGFNFYNSQYSIQHINPFADTDSSEAFPSGDPFLVYPGKDGEPLGSIRLMVLSEAIQDLRVLKQLEALRGRAHTEALIYELACQPLTFDDYPRNDTFFYELRRRAALDIG